MKVHAAIMPECMVEPLFTYHMTAAITAVSPALGFRTFRGIHRFYNWNRHSIHNKIYPTKILAC